MSFTGKAQYLSSGLPDSSYDSSYDNIEKAVMKYLIMNSGEYCTLTAIYNNLIKDDFSSIKDPQLLKVLRDKLGAIIQYLEINQKNISVIYNNKITHEYKYIVGYGIKNDTNLLKISEYTIQRYNSSIHETPNERDIFNATVDGNILKETCKEIYKETYKELYKNLLIQAIMFKDFPRVKIIIQKYKLSLFDIQCSSSLTSLTCNNCSLTSSLTCNDCNNIKNIIFNNNLLLLLVNEHYQEIQKINKKINNKQYNTSLNYVFYPLLLLFTTIAYFYTH